MAKRNITLVVTGLLVLAGLFMWMRPSGPDTLNQPVFEVRQGPLTISLTEPGTIQSRDRVIVSSEVEGRTTILWLIEEGTHVEEGDLLVELDASSLVDQKVEQQIRVLNAEAAFIRAREQLEIIRNQTAADIARAELDARFAELNLTKYVEGEYPQELQRAEADINLANEELQRANDKLAWSERLAEEGYVTRMELQADELAARRTQIDLELAQGKLHLLETYTHQQKLEELQSEVEQERLALERVRLRASADIVQAEADYRAKTSEFERQEDRLKQIRDQIEKCRIFAPASGMAVYTTTGQGRRGNDEPLREGLEVRERQDLIYLPTAAAMMAEVRIHESSLRKVNLDMPARVRVDAVPGRAFEGRVRRIGLLPDAQHGWLNPDLKVYQTDVFIDGDAEGLRPGMNCRAEIIIAELEDAVYIPLQSVVRVDSEAVVYVLGERGAQARVVEVGLDNNRMIQILAGLEAGEEVLLNPPLEAARRPER
jgi:HlyD family secretion protein